LRETHTLRERQKHTDSHTYWETHTETHRDRQTKGTCTLRETNTQKNTHIHTDTQTHPPHRHTQTHRDRDRGRHTHTHTHTQRERETHTEKHTQTQRHTHTHTHTHTQQFKPRLCVCRGSNSCKIRNLKKITKLQKKNRKKITQRSVTAGSATSEEPVRRRRAHWTTSHTGNVCIWTVQHPYPGVRHAVGVSEKPFLNTWVCTYLDQVIGCWRWLLYL